MRALLGKTGLSHNYAVNRHTAAVELYIDRGKDSGDESKSILGELHDNQEEIETEFGAPLNWQRLETKRACRIAKRFELGGFLDEDRWPDVHHAMIESMVKLEGALRPHIKKLSI